MDPRVAGVRPMLNVILNPASTENPHTCYATETEGNVVTRCQQTPVHALTLVYCECPDREGEHGHPGRVDDYASRYEVRLCCDHTEPVEMWPTCESSIPIAECVR